MITLNVAVNSYSNSVLSLLVSNQFMEIKSSVFKKFERDNLFQLCFSDSIERFQLFIFIFVIGIRNITQIGWNSSSEIWNRIFYPLILIYCTEFCIDGLKHAFITKFNHIHPSAYKYFKISVSNDLSSISQNVPDKSSIIARKMGFSALPHTCLVIVIIMDLFKGRTLNPVVFISIFGILLLLKFFSSFYLNSWTMTIQKNSKEIKSSAEQ